MDPSGTLVVTGAAGFIGGHLLPALAGAGRSILAVDTRPGEAAPGVRWMQADLSDPAGLIAAASERPFTLVHLAWDTARAPRFEVHGDHVRRLAGLLDAASGRGLERLVVLGSAEELGGASGVLNEEALPVSPLSPYGWGKSAARTLCREWSASTGLPVFWLRPFVAYGPGQRGDMLIPYALERAMRGEQAEFSAGTQRRDFVHVEDVADAIVRCVSSSLAGWNLFHIGTGEGVAVRDVVREIADCFQVGDRFAFGTRPMRPGEPAEQVADLRAARAKLGWSPRISWREGVRGLCDRARAGAR